MGVVDHDQTTSKPDATAGEVMTEGPTTVRPAEDLDGLLHRMHHAGAPAVLLTRPDGVLVGAVLATDPLAVQSGSR